MISRRKTCAGKHVNGAGKHGAGAKRLKILVMKPAKSAGKPDETELAPSAGYGTGGNFE